MTHLHSASPAPAPATVIPSVGALTERAAERFHSMRPFIRRFFERWPAARVANAAWLRALHADQEALRREFVHGAQVSNRLQCSFHVLLDFIAQASSAALTTELAGLPLAQRLRALEACVGFALKRGERELITILALGRAEQAATHHWGQREVLQSLEQRFGLPAGLLVARESPPAELFSLEPTYANPELAYGQELRAARRRQRLTLAQLAQAVGGHLQRLQAYEMGRQLPGHGRDSRARVQACALVLEAPQLLSAFRVSREYWDRTRPAAKAKDIRYEDYRTPEHILQLAAIDRWEDRRTGVPRGGKRHSGGALEASSKHKHHQYFSRLFAYWQLPADAPEARLRGLGRPAAEVSVLDIGEEALVRGMVKWLHFRTGRDCCAKSEAAILGKFGDYLAPAYGYFYLNSESLARTLPRASLERCPRVWPPGSDCAGTPCRTDAERIRARCYEAQRWLGPLCQEALHAPPNPDSLKDITDALARFPRYLLESMMTLLARIPRRVPRTTAEALEMQARAILAIGSWHPLRIRDYVRLTVSDLLLDAQGHLQLRIRPKKNQGSRRAQELTHEAVPPELAEPLEDYVRFARPILAQGRNPAHLFFNHAGGRITEYHLRAHLDKLALRYAPEIFPRGLRPHRMRTIVCTDLVDRFGWKAGSLLAAEALVDHENTIKRYYVVRTPHPPWRQAGPMTAEAAIAAAWRAATGRPFRRQPLR